MSQAQTGEKSPVHLNHNNTLGKEILQLLLAWKATPTPEGQKRKIQRKKDCLQSLPAWIYINKRHNQRRDASCSSVAEGYLSYTSHTLCSSSSFKGPVRVLWINKINKVHVYVKPWTLYYTMVHDRKQGTKKPLWNLTILSSNHGNLHSKMCVHNWYTFYILKYIYPQTLDIHA